MTLTFHLLTYLFISMTEWFLHKYMLHSTSGLLYKYMGKDHIDHHMNTKEDMRLKSGPDNYNGVRIPYKDTGYLIMFFIPTIFLIDKMLQSNLSTIYLIMASIGIPLFHNFSWNCIHMRAHYITNHNYMDGIPMTVRYPPDIIYNYLAWYHSVHHMKKGCNYNIVFPGADFLMGTYRG